MNSTRFLQTIRFYEAGPRSQQQPLVGAAVRVLGTAGSDHTATGRRATATARKYHTATGQLSGVRGAAPLPLGASDSFSSASNRCFCLALRFCSSLSASVLTVSNTVSATSCCHLERQRAKAMSVKRKAGRLLPAPTYRSEIVSGKYRYSSWSCSVSLMPLVSSSSNEPMSNASAAFTSPLGGISGGVYFW
uniref:Uncharacterized protein n=1 Tax=Anopheles merus TaxID=30066 RepID=A0A182V7F3_ANOME